MTKAKDLADKIDLHLQVNSPGFHMSDDDMRLIAASLRGGELPQTSREAIIEECASFIQSGAGMADLINQDDLDEQARLLRGIADTRPLRHSESK